MGEWTRVNPDSEFDIQIFAHKDGDGLNRHFDSHNTFAIKIKSSFRKKQCLHTWERFRRLLKEIAVGPTKKTAHSPQYCRLRKFKLNNANIKHGLFTVRLVHVQTQENE